MGEGRGKLEALIGDLETKKAELEKLIQEYELMLPHLTKAREALDEAGITDAGTAPQAPSAPVPQPVAAAPEAAPEAAPAPAPAAAAEAAPAAPPAAAEEPAEAAAPARRSIASLVADDDAAGDEATH